MSTLEFYPLCDVSYPWVAVDESKTIDTPGALYDSERAMQAIDELGETAKLLERLGFDGGLVTEQHGGSVGLVSSALVGATWMAAATTSLRIAAVGPILNGYLTPIRLAEEIALLDNLSRGRLSVGLPMGIGSQYHAYGVTNPSWARSRYREAHRLLLKALEESGPFTWEGEHFNVPYVNVWPRPIQRPYPEIWIPAAGSRESLELAARNRHTYMQVLVPRAQQRRNAQLFRELCEQAGYTPDPRQVVWVGSIYVAETDEQARLEFEAAQAWVFQSLDLKFHDAFPPGHVGLPSFRALMTHGGYRLGDDNPAAMTWDRAIEEGWLVAGSPETVCEQLGAIVDELGAGRVVLDSAAMPFWMKVKSLTLLAERVLPEFRPPGAHPSWKRDHPPIGRTVAESAAIDGPADRVSRVVDLGEDGLIDLAQGHVADARAAASKLKGNV